MTLRLSILFCLLCVPAWGQTLSLQITSTQIVAAVAAMPQGLFVGNVQQSGTVLVSQTAWIQSDYAGLVVSNNFERFGVVSAFTVPPEMLMQPGTNRLYRQTIYQDVVTDQMTTNIYVEKLIGNGFEMTDPSGTVQFLSTTNLTPPIYWETNMADSPFISPFLGTEYFRTNATQTLTWFRDSLP